MPVMVTTAPVWRRRGECVGVPHLCPAPVRGAAHLALSSAAVQALNGLGAEGWEAVGMTVLADESVAVLFKRPASDEYGTVACE